MHHLPVQCQYCGARFEVDRPAGAGPCPTCGAPCAWPLLGRASEADPERARKVAASLGPSFATLPGTLRRLWKESATTQHYLRAGHQIERREVVLHCAPGSGSRASQVTALPDHTLEDPWQVDSDSLRARTTCVSVCPGCAGLKRLKCMNCTGSGRIACSNCGGSGREAGERGSRACSRCRGRGDMKCSNCKSGSVDCHRCGAVGRVHAWLEVVCTRLAQVLVYPRLESVSLHRRVDDIVDFERPVGQYEHALLADTGWTSPESYRLPAELVARLDPRTDRLAATRTQIFRGVVYEFAFDIATGPGRILVGGQPPQVSGASNTLALATRRVISGVVLAVGVASALALAVYFAARGEWFSQGGYAAAVLGYSIIAALGLASTVHVMQLRHLDRVRGNLVAAIALFLVGACGSLTAWMLAAPSAASVAEKIGRGDLVATKVELAALKSTRDASGARLEAELARLEHDHNDAEHLESVKRQQTISAAVTEYAKPWHNDAQRQAAGVVLAQRTIAEVDTAIVASDANALRDIADAVATLDLETARRCLVLAAIFDASAALVENRFSDASKALDDVSLAKEAAPDAFDTARLALLSGVRTRHAAVLDESRTADDTALVLLAAEADQLSVIYETWRAPTDTPLKHSGLAQASGDAAARIEREVQREQKRLWAEAKRKADAQADAQRRYDRTALVCNDGTRSPSCTCGGSRRGCCSRHGGVSHCPASLPGG